MNKKENIYLSLLLVFLLFPLNVTALTKYQLFTPSSQQQPIAEIQLQGSPLITDIFLTPSLLDSAGQIDNTEDITAWHHILTLLKAIGNDWQLHLAFRDDRIDVSLESLNTSYVHLNPLLACFFDNGTIVNSIQDTNQLMVIILGQSFVQHLLAALSQEISTQTFSIFLPSPINTDDASIYYIDYLLNIQLPLTSEASIMPEYLPIYLNDDQSLFGSVPVEMYNFTTVLHPHNNDVALEQLEINLTDDQKLWLQHGTSY